MSLLFFLLSLLTFETSNQYPNLLDKALKCMLTFCSSPTACKQMLTSFKWPWLEEQSLLCYFFAKRYILSRILHTGFKTGKRNMSFCGENLHTYTHAHILILLCIIICLWQFKMFRVQRPAYKLFKEIGGYWNINMRIIWEIYIPRSIINF